MRVPNKQLFFLIFSSLLIIYEGKDKQTELKNNVPEHSNAPNWNNATGRRENSLSEDEESSDSDDDDESRNLSAKNTSSSTR